VATWKLMLQIPEMPTVLSSKGADGWPDIELGGQGFCFPAQLERDEVRYSGVPIRRRRLRGEWLSVCNEVARLKAGNHHDGEKSALQVPLESRHQGGSNGTLPQ